MSEHKKTYRVEAIRNLTPSSKLTVRKNLNADNLFATVRRDFAKVLDSRAGNSSIPLVDALMSGFAMFSLKDPSLLAFDRRRCEEPESLHGVYGIGCIPCDSQMRTILDEISPDDLRRPFRSLFHIAQRGKVLEKFTCLDGHYLLALDGTGIYSSERVGSDHCLQKRRKSGKLEYYRQMLAGAFVHPDYKEVIPFCPEMIRKQDGTQKNDCERNSVRRFLADFRREHPHLKVVVTEDALGANAPHVEDLITNDMRFILVVKPSGHSYLFETIDQAVREGRCTELIIPDSEREGVTHCFRFINKVALNKISEEKFSVNFLEYWEVDADGREQRFSWVTDLEITPENVNEIMRAGRARWRIENETFNTLKNQGYNLGHNYGLGKKHLSTVFTCLMMLAFLVDQLQQLCCPVFQAAWQKCKSKRRLWEGVRAYFRNFIAPSMQWILRAIIDGLKVRIPPPG